MYRTRMLPGVFLALCCAAVTSAADAPIGFRNDGSSVYPNAKTPVRWDGVTGQNVIWHTAMPNWTASSPIVVDKRIFTLAEPHTLLCADAATGRILWQRENNPLELIADEEERAKAEALLQEVRGRWIDVKSKQAELTHLRSVLACLDGEPGKAFKNNALCKRGEPLKEKLIAQLETIERAKVAAMRKRVEELSAEAKSWGDTDRPHGKFLSRKERRPWQQKARQLRQYGPQVENWYGWIGHTFATPVSDGERVYCSFGWGQVTCHTLDGQRQWIRRFPIDEPPDMMYTNSPVLSGERLIVIAGGVTRALDKSTGETLWEKPYPVRKENHSGSPIARTLYGTDVIITCHGRVYRAEDGEVLLDKLPHTLTIPILDGEKLYMSNDIHHGTPGKIRAYGMKLSGGDDVALGVETVWEANMPGHAGMWVGPALHDGILYYGYVQSILSLDANTGEKLVDYRHNEWDYGSSHAPNPVVAGGHFYTSDALGRTLVISTGPDGNPVTLNRLDSPFYRDHVFEDAKTLREKYWSKAWFPTWSFLSGTPFVAKDRLYMRTYGQLYCLGEK